MNTTTYPEGATMTITTMSPAEIDGELATIWIEENRVRGYLASEAAYDDRQTDLHGEGWTESLNGKQAAVRVEEYRLRLSELREQAAPFVAEYRARGGWLRYYLVNNSNGHVHRETSCSTCFVTTEYLWLTDLSDCDEAAMVAEYGETACTVCFPDAPSMKGYGDGTSGFAQIVQAERDARAAAKAERDAVKAAKRLDPALVLPSTWSHSDRQERIETVAAAKAAAKHAIDLLADGYPIDVDTHDEILRLVTERLSTEKGIDLSESLTKWRKAAERRNGR